MMNASDFIAVLFVAAVGTVTVGTAIDTVKPEQRTFTPIGVWYDPELKQVGQWFSVTGERNATARWQAKILRGDSVLCSGGSGLGTATYHDKTISKFTPSDWTGDNCGEPLPSDQLWARWTRILPSGAEVSVEWLGPADKTHAPPDVYMNQ